MAKFVQFFSSPYTVQEVANSFSSYLMNEGFEFITIKNEGVWRRGHGGMDAPQYIKLTAIGGGSYIMEAWIKFAVLPGLYIGKMGLTGSYKAQQRNLLKTNVEMILKNLNAQPIQAPQQHNNVDQNPFRQDVSNVDQFHQQPLSQDNQPPMTPYQQQMMRQMNRDNQRPMTPYQQQMMQQMNRDNQRPMTPYQQQMMRQMNRDNQPPMTPYQQQMMRQMNRDSQQPMTPYQQQMMRQMNRDSQSPTAPYEPPVQVDCVIASPSQTGQITGTMMVPMLVNNS